MQVCIGISSLLGVPGTVGSAPGVLLQPSQHHPGRDGVCSGHPQEFSELQGTGCTLGFLSLLGQCWFSAVHIPQLTDFPGLKSLFPGWRPLTLT